MPAADVLVVDDASPDGTGALADRLAAADSSIRVLHRESKDGLGRAYLAGFALALADGYAYVVEIDADGSHDPAELPRMLELARNADLVLGSRWVRGGAVRNWPWLRQAISRTANAYSRLMLRSRIRDITAGYRVFSAEALRVSASRRRCRARATASRSNSRGGWRGPAGSIVEHPITFVERENGRSKMQLGIVIEALLRVTVWGMTGTPSSRTAKG